MRTKFEQENQIFEQHLKEIINLNLLEKVSLKKIADQFGFTESWLQFKLHKNGYSKQLITKKKNIEAERIIFNRPFGLILTKKQIERIRKKDIIRRCQNPDCNNFFTTNPQHFQYFCEHCLNDKVIRKKIFKWLAPDYKK